MTTYFLRVKGLPDDAPRVEDRQLQSETLQDAQDEATILLRGDNPSWARDRPEWGRGAGPIASIVTADGDVVATRPTEAFDDSWRPAA